MSATRRVVVVDSKACNLHSVHRAIEACGGHPVVATEPRHLAGADAFVLPGVGNYAAVMSKLTTLGLAQALLEEMDRQPRPVLGICLGMQLLARSSAEGGAAGLGLVDGEVVRLSPAAPRERVPHIGWNEVSWRDGSMLAAQVPAGSDFYFVHSYHLRVPPHLVRATTPYCGGFTAAIEAPPVFGVQFHPEKSQRAGFQVIRNFLAL